MVLFEKINGYWRDGWIREFVNKEVLKIIYMYVYIYPIFKVQIRKLYF